MTVVELLKSGVRANAVLETEDGPVRLLNEKTRFAGFDGITGVTAGGRESRIIPIDGGKDHDKVMLDIATVAAAKLFEDDSWDNITFTPEVREFIDKDDRGFLIAVLFAMTQIARELMRTMARAAGRPNPFQEESACENTGGGGEVRCPGHRKC